MWNLYRGRSLRRTWAWQEAHTGSQWDRRPGTCRSSGAVPDKRVSRVAKMPSIAKSHEDTDALPGGLHEQMLGEKGNAKDLSPL